MITLRPAAERGHTDIGWLDGRHSFSFGEWYDPRHMGYRTLRVINDDRVAPASGFAMHGHRDMEIVTVVLEGALRHVDSLGHEGVLRAGDVQAMSAGSGVRHSEWNASETEGLHLLQIWILPRSKGTPAWYADGRVPLEERRGRLVLAVAGDRCGEPAALRIGQDANLWLGMFASGQSARHELAEGRAAYVHVARGTVRVAGRDLGAGDAAVVEAAGEVTIEGRGEGGEVLLFDLGPLTG